MGSDFLKMLEDYLKKWILEDFYRFCCCIFNTSLAVEKSFGLKKNVLKILENLYFV